MTEIANDWPATPAAETRPELLEEARKRYRRAGNSTNLARNLESWIASANDVPVLLAEVTRLRAELDRTGSACQLLGKVVTGMARSMEAARIQMLQVGAEEAMEWILDSLPDVDDNDPADQWNGTETAQEWFDRTDERASGAAPAPVPAAPEIPGQMPLPGVTL